MFFCFLVVLGWVWGWCKYFSFRFGFGWEENGNNFIVVVGK